MVGCALKIHKQTGGKRGKATRNGFLWARGQIVIGPRLWQVCVHAGLLLLGVVVGIGPGLAQNEVPQQLPWLRVCRQRGTQVVPCWVPGAGGTRSTGVSNHNLHKNIKFDWTVGANPFPGAPVHTKNPFLQKKSTFCPAAWQNENARRLRQACSGC